MLFCNQKRYLANHDRVNLRRFMTVLSKKELRFIQSRRRFVRLWNAAAIIMLATLGLLTTWLMLTAPYLANPVFVAEQLRAGLIDEPVFSLSVVMLPVIVLLLFAVVAIFIALGYAVFAHERRYLKIIDTLLGPAQSNCAKFYRETPSEK